MKKQSQIEQKLKNLTKENLQKVILELTRLLSADQRQELDKLLEDCASGPSEGRGAPVLSRMAQSFVDEKMEEIRKWIAQIDEGELYLNTEEYEDYSSGYWDREWITDYYDNQGIGEKIAFMVRFAEDCVNAGYYQEANEICEWLWEMSVDTDSEYDSDPADLEILSEQRIIHVNMKEFALLTLYTAYQVLEPEKRAEGIYLYFSSNAFQELHLEEMFRMGRENLTGTEQFWKDWTALLAGKDGDVAGRLLKEAVLYNSGTEGLVSIADENCRIHPALYLAAMEEYDKSHDYLQIEQIGKRALEKLDKGLIVRSETALMAAYASSCLQHTEDVMAFCWEAFCSDATDRNFLRLFGMKEMAEKYGMRGREVLAAKLKGDREETFRNRELRQNVIGESMYYKLCFYTGDFGAAKQASRNPKGSLGWSGSFIYSGIRLFLLYLYQKPLPSKAAALIAQEAGFLDDKDASHVLGFENTIIGESSKRKVSIFWEYFQRWKPYFQLDAEEQKKYLAWAEKIVRSRADAIVSGQHRGHYGGSAALLAMAAEIKEDMGEQGARHAMFAEYKGKFPRHSSFQAEMRNYFGMKG